MITQRIIVTDLKSLLAIDRAEFTADFKKDLSEILDKHNIGIEVVSVLMESIHPPMSVASAYEAVMSAGIDAETIIIQAENAKNIQIQNAQAQKNEIISKANAEHYSKVATATASVSEFNASVAASNENKNSYQYYKYLDALTQAYGKSNLILVGDGIDTSKIYFGNINNAIMNGTNNNTQTDTGTETVS